MPPDPDYPDRDYRDRDYPDPDSPDPNSFDPGAPEPGAQDSAGARPSVLAYVAGGLALAVLLAGSVFFFAVGLLAPLWAVIVFVLIWVTLFVLGVLWIRRHPLRVIVLPVIAAAVWFGGLAAGERLLGWTA